MWITFQCYFVKPFLQDILEKVWQPNNMIIITLWITTYYIFTRNWLTHSAQAVPVCAEGHGSKKQTELHHQQKGSYLVLKSPKQTIATPQLCLLILSMKTPNKIHSMPHPWWDTEQNTFSLTAKNIEMAFTPVIQGLNAKPEKLPLPLVYNGRLCNKHRRHSGRNPKRSRFCNGDFGHDVQPSSGCSKDFSSQTLWKGN